MKEYIDLHTLPCVKQTAGKKLLQKHRERSPVLCDELEGWGKRRVVRTGGDMSILAAESRSCTTTTSTM